MGRCTLFALWLDQAAKFGKFEVYIFSNKTVPRFAIPNIYSGHVNLQAKLGKPEPDRSSRANS